MVGDQVADEGDFLREKGSNYSLFSFRILLMGFSPAIEFGIDSTHFLTPLDLGHAHLINTLL